MLIDSHCHLDFPDFAPERAEVIARARRAGIARMLTISVRLSTFPDVRAIAREEEGVYCSVGVHPHQAEEEPVDEAAALLVHTDDPVVIGIGETGLDYYYDNSPRDRQRTNFAAHIEAARESGLPLIVHTRDADQDTVAMLRDGAADGRLRGVIHCFSSGRALAEAALEIGFYISLSGILTFKKAEELRSIIADVPLDRLLVETDAPYLAPVPMRGKRNEPAYVAHTAAALAQVKGVTPEQVAAVTTENFFTLFSKAA